MGIHMLGFQFQCPLVGCRGIIGGHSLQVNTQIKPVFRGELFTGGCRFLRCLAGQGSHCARQFRHGKVEVKLAGVRIINLILLLNHQVTLVNGNPD